MSKKYYGEVEVKGVILTFDDKEHCPFRRPCNEWCDYKYFVLGRKRCGEDADCVWDDTCPLRHEREEPLVGEF